ncbi:MAG: molybdopterin molybdotransferase MoeA [Syntrophales bacterium]|jgi:molybdopterin molybdotransferase|nr:molybdopterin molybdotransferase MoeA [Syntrophales bacterium]MDD4338704.1 molybdopterin molybdotransferase MoeA [Syntrophales bacterium]HPB69649.1 molybdopterin molybdotransferase MoeA [Syntrophales bacterium]HQN26389.1 molybdopterin molybdotransferase MoeA [Syntrophales bacterium]HQP27918.1 molybdopterin molybdotransferase MoeA [Syntrophales bacterium]
MISVQQALEQILSAISPLGSERVSLLAALGRVAAEDVDARRAIPPRDNSAMDGYALRWEDTLGATRESPVILEVVEDIPAGKVPEKTVVAGTAARIMTGAPIPDGADAVMKMEETEKDGSRVRIFAAASAGLDIRRAGEDVRPGERIVRKGDVLTPARIGMLASVGRAVIDVHQRPTVAVLATGNELVDVDEAFLTEGKIVSSNSYSLAAQVLDCGAVPLQIGIARDTREDLIAKFNAALRADIILSSGGVSVGDYDLVKEIMKEVGNRMQFWQVAMRPGKPLAFGTLGGVPLFGLPGNPVSSMVSFEQFVRPALLKMMGRRNLFRRIIQACLDEDVQKHAGARNFLRARVEFRDGRYHASTTGEQGSGILKSMVLANGLIVIPEAVTHARAGEEVTVQLIDGSLEGMAEPEYLKD